MDLQQSLALCAHADAQDVVVAISSRARPAVYRDEDHALAEKLGPHRANVCRLMDRLMALERHVRTLEAAVECVPLAMMMLDAQGTVLRMNCMARKMLGTGAALRLDQGRPEACVGPQPLRLIIDEAVRGMQVRGSLQRRAGTTMLRDERGVVVTTVRVHPLLGGATGEAAAVMFLQQVTGQCRGGLANTLRQLFALTSGEAMLACALLESGGLAVAAGRCGITPGTAQTRLKLIYDKVGVRGQLALVQMLTAVAAVEAGSGDG